MKKLILLLLVASVGFVSCDKEEDIPKNEVPAVVLNAFENEFPNAADVEWEKKKSGYEADFEIDLVDYSAFVNSAGEIEKVKYDIQNSELPAAVTEAITTSYSDEVIDDADVLEIGGETFYQIEFEGGLTENHVIFDASGNEAPDVEAWD